MNLIGNLDFQSIIFIAGLILFIIAILGFIPSAIIPHFDHKYPLNRLGRMAFLVGSIILLSIAVGPYIFEQINSKQLIETSEINNNSNEPRIKEAISWNEKGIDRYNDRLYNESLQAFEKALELNPQYTDAWYNKAKVLNIIDREHEAISAYNKVIEYDPQNISAWASKGMLLYYVGKYEEAIQAYDKVIELDPQNSFAYHEKGYILYRYMGRYEEAIQAYDKAIELDPQYFSAWLDKGHVLVYIGRYEEAIQAYDKAIEVDPQHPFPWVHKSYALEKLGKTAEAQACYDKAKTLGYTEGMPLI